MSNSDIEQSGTVKGRLPNGANLSGRISNGLSLSGHISIGSVAGDFIIKMTVEGNSDGGYTVTSCDATVEQIDAAVSAEKRVVVIATDTTSGEFWELPIVQALQGNSYYFGACLMVGEFGKFIFSFVQNESEWQFSMERIDAGNVDYENIEFGKMSVGAALDMSLGIAMRLYPDSHTHSNKDTLDKLSVSNGKLQYNGSDVGLKGDKGEPGKAPVKGTDYWTAADKTEIVNDTLAALPTWTGGNY